VGDVLRKGLEDLENVCQHVLTTFEVGQSSRNCVTCLMQILSIMCCLAHTRSCFFRNCVQKL